MPENFHGEAGVFDAHADLLYTVSASTTSVTTA